MNCEQIRAYGENFTIDERAHAVSELSAWFKLDSWTVREGLLLLVGINPYRSKDLLLTESGFESTPNPSWARITATPGLSANEVDTNGWPRITGLVIDLFQIELLSQLLNLWTSKPEHTLTGRHEPHYYLQWSSGKGCPPFWYEWASDAKLFISKAPAQTAATPAPVVAVSASGGSPDPERRLARLRELGGNAKYSRCDWQFAGIGKLVASEKSEGRNRNDEKTIRADLREAAQAEQDEKRAGFGSGLGQR